MLELDAGDPQRYRTPEGYQRFDTLHETIEVAGGDSVVLAIDSTVWGPVVEHGEDGRPLQALRWLDLHDGALPGDDFLPRVQRPDAGASQRMAVSPGREQEGYLHMPGGQSGHPLSPFQRAGHAAWVEGVASPFLPGETQHRLELLPVHR